MHNESESHSVMSDSVTPWTVACQGPLSMEFSRKNTVVSTHSLLQGLFPTQRTNPHLLYPLHWQVGSLPPSATWKAPALFDQNPQNPDDFQREDFIAEIWCEGCGVLGFLLIGRDCGEWAVLQESCLLP